jgi:hypothetical protein
MEITIYFFDEAYQYKTLVVKDTTKNNLYSGTIAQLKKDAKSGSDLWAEARDANGEYLFRVKQHKYAKDSYLVGLILEPYLITWMDPELISPEYSLEVIHKQ